MNESIAKFHAEHVNFARLLDLLEAQVAAFHAGEQPDYDLMRDIVYYLRQYGDRCHHPCEDVVFARLVERAPNMRLPINRHLQEHRVIANAGDDLFGKLNEAAADIPIARAALEASAATYLVYYRHHLNVEEREVMPRAAELLTPEDWSAVAAALPGGPDPLFGKNVETRFDELRRQIALEAGVQRTERN